MSRITDWEKLALVTLLALSLCSGQVLAQDTTPDVLHYRFDEGTSTTVENLASSPPLGAEVGTLHGALTQDGTDLNSSGTGFSLRGSGQITQSDRLDTGWALDLGNGSWTISFVTSDIPASATLFYLFGETATELRCFTNGVAGPNNWILRGTGMTDVLASGAATTAITRTTFVYDAKASVIHAYVNGVLNNSVPQVAAAISLTSSSPLLVSGYSLSSVGLPLNGLLDDFRVYRRALSPEEVAGIDLLPEIFDDGFEDVVLPD